jgi:GT2 family glycosyltransferase
LGLPYTRPDVRKFTRSLANFTASSQIREIFIMDHHGSGIEEARNHLFTRWKANPTDFFLFADNDAGWAPGSIDRLVEHNLPVVCGGMYTRDLPPRPTIGVYMGKDAAGRVRYQFQGYTNAIVSYCYSRGITALADNEQLFEDPELFEIDGCGMHFTLIRRDVMEAFGPPWFLMQGKTGAGEDFWFCKKARDAGFKIYTDLSVQTAHYAGEENSFGLRELLKVYELIDHGDKESELIVG